MKKVLGNQKNPDLLKCSQEQLNKLAEQIKVKELDEGIMIKRKRNKSNLVDNGIKLIVQCKSGGLCIKNPRTMADVKCIGCEKESKPGD